jgi:cobalt/nickel transport system ATP-binding protein
MLQKDSPGQAISSSSTDPVITIADLSFSYPDQPNILEHLSLAVARGDRIGVIGHNGCGKTTLFLLICGVLKPARGHIILLDRPVKPGEFRPEIGLVFQNPSDQLFSPTVWDDVAFAPQNMGLAPDVVEERVQQVLAVTGIGELADRPPHHLSGGEKRMVAIAGILAMQPQVILYDEPTANLDLRARRRLIQFLQSSQETLLISSHDLEFLLEVCDRIILIDSGGIVADGLPHQIMGDAELMTQHGLEKPHSLLPHSDPHHG